MKTVAIKADEKAGSAGTVDLDRALQLLAQARKLHNQTVQDSRECDEWHKQVDNLLRDTAQDDASERWDHPPRVKQRKCIASLFHRR